MIALTERMFLFADLVQADVICCVAKSVGTSYTYWYPRSLIYCHDVGTLELFALRN